MKLRECSLTALISYLILVPMSRPGARTRKISTSLELELKMLSITDMFAIVICP